MPKDENMKFPADRFEDDSLRLMIIREKALDWWNARNPKRNGKLTVPTGHGRFYTPGYQ